jgi:hypothetical protein
MIRESDKRRQLIEALDNDIGDPFRLASMPVQSLSNCQMLIEALEYEYEGYAGVLMARVYYDAFQISIAHGDQARASMFAVLAYKMRVICEGEDSPETQRVKLLASKPSAYLSFGMCSQDDTSNGTQEYGDRRS